MLQNEKDEVCHKMGRNRARLGPGRSAQSLLAAIRAPISSVLSMWNPNRMGKPPFARDAI
jgi:hypothetical protein